MPEALLLTSAHAAQLAGPDASRFRDLPVLTVGARTADAAKAAGFRHVLQPAGVEDIHTLMAHLATTGFRRLLHLAGRDHVDSVLPQGVTLERRIVYRIDLVPALDADACDALRAGAIDWVLLYSPRTARHFAALADAAGLPRDRIALAAISANAAQATGAGWRQMAIATRPTEAGLLAIAGLSCNSEGA